MAETKHFIHAENVPSLAAQLASHRRSVMHDVDIQVPSLLSPTFFVATSAPLRIKPVCPTCLQPKLCQNLLLLFVPACVRSRELLRVFSCHRRLTLNPCQRQRQLQRDMTWDALQALKQGQVLMKHCFSLQLSPTVAHVHLSTLLTA